MTLCLEVFGCLPVAKMDTKQGRTNNSQKLWNVVLEKDAESELDRIPHTVPTKAYSVK